MESNSGSREVCGVGACAVDAEVKASVGQIDIDERGQLGSRDTAPRLYCFEHFVELVENTSEDVHVSAIGKTESGEWEDPTEMRPGVMMFATPALERRLNDYLETA